MLYNPEDGVEKELEAMVSWN